MTLAFKPAVSEALADIPARVIEIWPRLGSGDYLVTLEYEQPVKCGRELIRHIDAFFSELYQPRECGPHSAHAGSGATWWAVCSARPPAVHPRGGHMVHEAMDTTSLNHIVPVVEVRDKPANGTSHTWWPTSPQHFETRDLEGELQVAHMIRRICCLGPCRAFLATSSAHAWFPREPSEETSTTLFRSARIGLASSSAMSPERGCRRHSSWRSPASCS